ncbi:hypothetical protein ACQ4M3_27845 [Leptolyngbya sp. AN03gr2]|uniref:hypothetical protein n=1 Tax=unclassified Leptolyngbya TaxID=2650499 RepID=UPI003D31836B
MQMQSVRYSEDTILELFRFIDLMATLPPELDLVFDAEIRRFGAENAMPYLTTIERFAQIRTVRENILEVLAVRFGTLPSDLAQQLEQVNDTERLKQLLRQSITVASVNEF